MNSTFAFHLFALTQGIALLALLQLWVDKQNVSTKWEMAGCVGSICLISLAPMSVYYDQTNIGFAIALVLIGFLTIGPTLWFLILKLTHIPSETVKTSRIAHLITPVIALGIALWLVMIPREQQLALFLQDTQDEASMHRLILPTLFALFIFWLLQSGWYIVAITRRLMLYRSQLRRYFSNTEQRDLRWITWFGNTFIISWGILALSHFMVFAQYQFLTMEAGALMSLCLLLLLVLNGHRQKPGFDAVPESEQELSAVLAAKPLAEPEHRAQDSKYENSALSSEDVQRYWHRLEHWMHTESGFLKADLTMPGLAKSVGISASYISQTLSEAYGSHFYDYVNQKRVEYACTRLTLTDETVLDIALNAGFNSRSSFYTAFKKHKNLTPSQFRAQYRQQQEGI